MGRYRYRLYSGTSPGISVVSSARAGREVEAGEVGLAVVDLGGVEAGFCCCCGGGSGEEDDVAGSG